MTGMVELPYCIRATDALKVAHSTHPAPASKKAASLGTSGDTNVGSELKKETQGKDHEDQGRRRRHVLSVDSPLGCRCS